MIGLFEGILTDVFAALAADRTGDGGYDLTGPDSVVWGDGGLPFPGGPLVSIGGMRAPKSYDDGANMGEYGTRFEMDCWCYAPHDGSGPLASAKAAARLAGQVMDSVHGAHRDPLRTTLYDVERVLVSLQQVFGDAPQQPAGYGVAYLTIEIRTGTGGSL